MTVHSQLSKITSSISRVESQKTDEPAPNKIQKVQLSSETHELALKKYQTSQLQTSLLCEPFRTNFIQNKPQQQMSQMLVSSSTRLRKLRWDCQSKSRVSLMPPLMLLMPKTITFSSMHMSQAIPLLGSSINREANEVEIHEKLSV